MLAHCWLTPREVVSVLLGKSEIKRLTIIRDGEDNSYREGSYDLRIGRIVPPKGAPTDEEEYILPPHGGMAEVISAESVVVPEDILGYASIKTGVSDQGVLAINIGIVDPGYKGPLSTTLINFSKSPYVLAKGGPFLRVTFHEMRLEPRWYPAPRSEAPSSASRGRREVSAQEYLGQKRRKATAHFSDSFLDLERTVNDIADTIFEKWRNSAFMFFGFLLLVMAGLSFAFNVWIRRDSSGSNEATLRKLVDEAVEARLAALRVRPSTEAPTPDLAPPPARLPPTEPTGQQR